jgi:nucleoside recognition membrane protein YjiH
VAVIVPLGAAVVNLLTRTGGLDFIGVLATPVMRPLYGLPGRAALDIMTSWVGSYSVGLYITKSVFDMGGYTKRQAFIIATCFSTVSIGFVGVVASTLDLLHLFPLIFLGYFVAVFGSAALLVRVYPTSRIPQDTIAPAMADDPPPRGRLFRTALERAAGRAAESGPALNILGRGLWDGLVLAGLILGTILSVGSAALVLANTTTLFDLAGLPLRPLYEFLHIPDAPRAATATLIEIAEMYLPAVLVADSPAFTKFFIAVLSTSQLIFFSSVAPMILEMFREIPVRVTHLLLLFVERTVILVPLAYLYTLLVSALGFLGS